MIDLELFIKRPDSFDIEIAITPETGVPYMRYRDAFLDKPGSEMLFPMAMEPAVNKTATALDAKMAYLRKGVEENRKLRNPCGEIVIPPTLDPEGECG